MSLSLSKWVIQGRLFNSHTHEIENWNWAGVISLIVSAGIGILPISTKTFSLGFLVTFFLSLILYPVLRKIMPEGTATSFASEVKALDVAE